MSVKEVKFRSRKNHTTVKVSVWDELEQAEVFVEEMGEKRSKYTSFCLYGPSVKTFIEVLQAAGNKPAFDKLKETNEYSVTGKQVPAIMIDKEEAA